MTWSPLTWTVFIFGVRSFHKNKLRLGLKGIGLAVQVEYSHQSIARYGALQKASWTTRNAHGECFTYPAWGISYEHKEIFKAIRVNSEEFEFYLNYT